MIKKIIGEYGWSGTSVVGKDGSHEFWLLVQHQDKDVELQLECLKLLEEKVIDLNKFPFYFFKHTDY